jgi:hypothetical protein
MISPSLNIVLPLYRENGELYAHIHSQPIGVTAYDVHFRLLIRTYELMIADGASAFSSASRYLKLAAEGMAPEGTSPEAVYLPLLKEIERLSFAIIATKTGWDTIPLSQAVAQKLLEPGDDIEAVNSSVFFTAVWHVAPKSRREATLEYGTNRSGAHTSSLQLMDLIASLPTPTDPATTIATDAAGPSPGPSQSIAPAGSPISLTV